MFGNNDTFAPAAGTDADAIGDTEARGRAGNADNIDIDNRKPAAATKLPGEMWIQNLDEETRAKFLAAKTQATQVTQHKKCRGVLVMEEGD